MARIYLTYLGTDMIYISDKVLRNELNKYNRI
jgi:hypothetical protein